MKKLLSLSVLLFCWVPSIAQTETAVSMHILNDSLPPLSDSPAIHFKLQPQDLRRMISVVNEPLFPDSTSSLVLFQPSFYYANFVIMPSGGLGPFRWGDFQVGGFLDKDYYPGLMDIESGSLGLQYNHGRISAYAGGIVNKYAFYQGLYTQIGATANISYMFSSRLSATLFGTFYWGNGPRMSNGAPMPPSMLGFYNVSRFGGYVDYRVSEHFGVQAGAQMVQQVGPRTHYELQPIVTPYFKVGKVAIGLPVGQILNGVVKDQIERRDHRRR